MKRAACILSFASLLFVAPGCVGSRQHSPPTREWHPPSAILEKYANKNGIVTRAAMEAGLKADFAAADTNHDGCLGADEVRVINLARWKEDASTASPLIDFHRTGCIDFDEFAATPRSLFDQLDKDGSGKLTPKELHPGGHAQP